jgi:hypothetical protein
MRSSTVVGSSFILVLVACSKPSVAPAPAPSASTAATATGSASAASTAVATASQPSDTSEPDDEAGSFGSLVDAKEFDGAIAVVAPSALGEISGAIPSSVTLTNLPAISQQGTAKHQGAPGTCEAQSFGYGLGGYTAARASDGHALWDPSKPENEISAAFLYAWEHKQHPAQCGHGSGALGYLSRLASVGAPSASEVPYKPECPYLDGASYLAGSYPDQTRFRIGSYATLHLSSAALPLVKELLAAGHAIAFSGPVLKGYGDPKLEDGVLYGNATVPQSGHGQLLVGYDDAKGKAGEKGAFLVQNSFGEGWPKSAPGGRIWISYNTLLETQKLAAVAYSFDPSAVTGDMLASKSGPAASVQRVFQAESKDGAMVVLMHHFKEPVLIKSVTWKAPGKKTVVANVGAYMQAGYTYLRRADGKGFSAGDWTITIDAATVSGDAVEYSGNVAVPAPPASRPAAAMGEVLGPTGAAATIH